MQFDSLQAFFEMAGHGPFVWAAYALTFVILLSLCTAPIMKMRKVKAEIRRIQVRDSQIANHDA